MAQAEAVVHASLDNDHWREALEMAARFVARLKADERFSDRFEPCIAALASHVATAAVKIWRLGQGLLTAA